MYSHRYEFPMFICIHWHKLHEIWLIRPYVNNELLYKKIQMRFSPLYVFLFPSTLFSFFFLSIVWYESRHFKFDLQLSYGISNCAIISFLKNPQEEIVRNQHYHNLRKSKAIEILRYVTQWICDYNCNTY